MVELYDMEKRRRNAEELDLEGLKCDFCDKPAVRYSSPFGNPDEPKVCEEHYQSIRNNVSVG